MKIVFDHFKERQLYNKIVIALTEYENDDSAKTFFEEYFYDLLCEIQRTIDAAEKESF